MWTNCQIPQLTAEQVNQCSDVAKNRMNALIQQQQWCQWIFTFYTKEINGTNWKKCSETTMKVNNECS